MIGREFQRLSQLLPYFHYKMRQIRHVSPGRNRVTALQRLIFLGDVVDENITTTEVYFGEVVGRRLSDAVGWRVREVKRFRGWLVIGLSLWM